MAEHSEPNPKRICSPSHDLDIYNSDEEDISDFDDTCSSSSNSLEMTDGGLESSDGFSVSLMDDGPCDFIAKDGTKWWNERPANFQQDESFKAPGPT